MPIASFSLLELKEALASPGGSKRTLDAFDAALADPGAFRLTCAPEATEQVQEMLGVTRRFFELPLEEKVASRYADDQFVGWCGGDYLGQYGSADHKEMFHIGPRVAPTLGAHGPGGSVPVPAGDLVGRARETCVLWPAVPDDFVATWHGYYRRMQEVAALLGSVLAGILGIDEATWFDTMRDNWADLAANYYPPIDEEARASGTPTYNAAHRDLTVFTILYQDQSPSGGLSVEAVDGVWEAVEPVEGTFVVNVGELLTYLSGGRWRAAPHRVTVSPTASAVARISLPFFYRPNDARIVQSFVDPAAPPIAVGDWVVERKRGSRAIAT